MNILPSNCDCERCSRMCRAPCCGIPEDFKKLIEAGYGDRLMYDDLPGGAVMLKPALKGYEGKRAPWDVSSKEGCTFWKEGKCELHHIGLKPTQGKLVIHQQAQKDIDQIIDYIDKSWKKDDAEEVLDLWLEGRDLKQEYEEHALEYLRKWLEDQDEVK